LLGGISDIPALVKKHDIGVILSTNPVTEKEANEYIFDLCRENNLRLLFLNDLLLMVDRQVTQPVGSFEYPIWLDERLEFKAMHDDVTGLPNRFLFQDRLKRSLAYARRYGTRLAVIFISVSGFESSSTRLGRKYRDHALLETARRLNQCKRDSDTLAYVNENCFAIILENIAEADTTRVVAQRFIKSLAEPIWVEGQEVQICSHVDTYHDKDGYDNLENLTRLKIMRP
jgi:diguanylate cyclase (GGDEF)-like protein